MNKIFLAQTMPDVTEIGMIIPFAAIFIVFGILAFLSQGGGSYKREVGKHKGWGKGWTISLWTLTVFTPILYLIFYLVGQ